MIEINFEELDNDTLIKFLGNGSWKVREAAADALRNRGDRKAVKPLIELLLNTDEYIPVRMAAARALGNIGDPRAVKPLIELLLKNKKWEMRTCAAKALGNIGAKNPKLVKNAIKPLIELLGSEYITVREAAAEALGKIGAKNPELVKKAIGPLIGLLKNKDRGVHESAVRALGKIGDLRAVGPLIELLKDERWYVRDAAKGSLDNIRKSDKIKYLITILDIDGSKSVVEIFNEIKNPNKLETLINTWDEDIDSNTRNAIVEALVCIGLAHLEVNKKICSILMKWSETEKNRGLKKTINSSINELFQQRKERHINEGLHLPGGWEATQTGGSGVSKKQQPRIKN